MIRRVVLDGLPLQVRSAGIRVYTESLVRAMAQERPDIGFTLFGLGARGLRLLRQPARPDHPWPPNVRWMIRALYPAIMGYPFPWVPRLRAIDGLARNADVFHATNYAAPRTRRTALVVTVYDLTLLRMPELGTPALRRLVRCAHGAAAAAQRVIVPSQATRRDVVELLGVPDDRVRVVYGACHARFEPLPRPEARDRVAARLGLHAPYILHVGTLEPRKNLATLLRAYARLSADGSRPHLVLAGEPGWQHRSLYRLVENLGVRSMVHFTGAVADDDLPSLYAAAEVFAYPSLYEGFGLPPLEAMACGTPVVVSNVSALPEIVGDAGLGVDPRDTAALTAALQRALTDAMLRQEMRARGLARARGFSWQRCAADTLAVYEEAVSAAWRGGPTLAHRRRP